MGLDDFRDRTTCAAAAPAPTTVAVANCSFRDNVAKLHGGAIAQQSGNLSIQVLHYICNPLISRVIIGARFPNPSRNVDQVVRPVATWPGMGVASLSALFFTMCSPAALTLFIIYLCHLGTSSESALSATGSYHPP